MKSDPEFAIVGGGIGGLTLAIALQRRNFNVRVYENAPALKPLGAGLGLGGNAMKAFSEIGLDDEVMAISRVMKRVVLKDESGRRLSETDSQSLSEKLGVINNFTVHRADLHKLLLSRLKPGTVILGKGCRDFSNTPEGVILNFSDDTQAQADYVIACDGIQSVFRATLLPGSTPRYAGYTCWRAVVDVAPAGINMQETSETWGAGRRFGIVPLTNNRIYWFAVLNAKANDPALKNYTVHNLRKCFEGFHSDVQKILEHTADRQLIWSDIIDLKPLKQFAFGNMVLMGDAAHATTPNMGQGACMAIEDAVVLANCLEDYSTPEEAFKQFERKRLPRTTKIVRDSWRLGKVAQWENPVLTRLRNVALRSTPASVVERQARFLQDVSFY